MTTKTTNNVRAMTLAQVKAKAKQVLAVVHAAGYVGARIAEIETEPPVYELFHRGHFVIKLKNGIEISWRNDGRIKGYNASKGDHLGVTAMTLKGLPRAITRALAAYNQQVLVRSGDPRYWVRRNNKFQFTICLQVGNDSTGSTVVFCHADAANQWDAIVMAKRAAAESCPDPRGLGSKATDWTPIFVCDGHVKNILGTHADPTLKA
jgi:hypothetical protein